MIIIIIVIIINTCSAFHFQVNTAMVPQSPQHPVPKGISVQIAQNLPPSILADRGLTTMSLTKPLSRRASCVTQGSTVRVLHVCGPMTSVMKASSALVDRGPSVQETLVWLIMTMQQAPLTAVTECLNVCAQHGTKLQVEQKRYTVRCDKL